MTLKKLLNIHMIDDDELIFDLLKDYFEETPYELTASETPEKGLDYIKNNKVDLVILDLMLPGIDGFEVCKILRNENELLPIIMLTAKKDDFNKIVGLELGADDYMSKPFNPRELLARIKTVLRRFEKTTTRKENELPLEKNDVLIHSPAWDLTLNTGSRQVIFKNRVLDFTSTEFDLLKCLMENVGIVQSRETLMNKVKGIEFDAFDRSIDVFISKLRNKLGDKNKEEIIKTVRGIGYIFQKL